MCVKLFCNFKLDTDLHRLIHSTYSKKSRLPKSFLFFKVRTKSFVKTQMNFESLVAPSQQTSWLKLVKAGSSVALAFWVSFIGQVVRDKDDEPQNKLFFFFLPISLTDTRKNFLGSWKDLVKPI